MAQKIVTMCDAHLAAGEDVPGEAWEVSILSPGDDVPREYAADLCTAHAAKLVELVGFIGNQGRTPEPEPLTCPECGKGFKTAQAVSLHRRRAKGHAA